MNTYQSLTNALTTLLGADTAVRIRVDGVHAPVDRAIGTSADDNRLIALCHYGEQNGDLMRDPEIVFELMTDVEPSMAEPLSFQLFQEE